MSERKEYIRKEGNCEIKEIIEADGSKSVCFLNEETGVAHISTFDADDRMVMSVHGYVEEPVNISDEEMDAYLHELLKLEEENRESCEEESEVEFEKKVNPDGSYAEIITDQQDNWGEIREYDTEGNCVNAVYFKLS